MDPNSGIQFEEDKFRQSMPSFEDEVPKIVKLVMKLSGGAITEQRQAEYVLFGFVLVTILLAFFILFFFGGSSPKPPVPSINGTHSLKS